MPSALGPDGHHRKLLQQADHEMAREQRRLRDTRDLLAEVRRTQKYVEAFNQEQRDREAHSSR